MTSQPSHSHPQAGKGKGLIADGNVSIPSGNITDLTPHREIQELNQVKDAGTDKHDHGWRYIVRNFRPEYDDCTVSSYYP